jgi:hypothetical protein
MSRPRGEGGRLTAVQRPPTGVRIAEIHAAHRRGDRWICEICSSAYLSMMPSVARFAAYAQ